MDKRDLKDRYEATGDEAAYEEALPLYEEAIANGADPQDFIDYGYLLECHARNLLRRAVASYEHALEIDPNLHKAYYKIIGARAGRRETELAIALHEKRLAAAPDDIREYRFLASAYLAAHAYGEAAEVIERGLAVAPDDSILIGCRAEVRGETGDSEGALSDWRRPLELDPHPTRPLHITPSFPPPPPPPHASIDPRP